MATLPSSLRPQSVLTNHQVQAITTVAWIAPSFIGVGVVQREPHCPRSSTNTGTDAHFIMGHNAMLLTPSPVLPPLPTEEYEALKDDIARNGVRQPILITSSGVIVDGHERFRAVTELGIREYPVLVVGNITEQERQEMAISSTSFAAICWN